ncbi:hypothetical protein KZW06_30295, partial [Klebsiella pneumoniae]|nr:hypothetical protein [Klebsiella pneumoniae]
HLVDPRIRERDFEDVAPDESGRADEQQFHVRFFHVEPASGARNDPLSGFLHDRRPTRRRQPPNISKNYRMRLLRRGARHEPAAACLDTPGATLVRRLYTCENDDMPPNPGFR